MTKNNYDANLIADFMVAFPKPVKEAFDDMMSDKENHKDNLKMKLHYTYIMHKMKESLKKIEDDIEQEIN